MSEVLIIDMLAHGPGKRRVTMDVLGTGPRTIAGVLEKNNVNTRIAPGEIFLSRNIIMNEHKAVFISGMTTDIIGVKKVIMKWKKKTGNKPVVVGGPLTMNPEILISINADIAVVGEAEETVEELVNKTSLLDGKIYLEELENIKGIIFRKNSEVFINKRRPLLDSAKLNKYHPSVDVIKDYPGFWYYRVYVETVRGCSNLKIAREALTLPNIEKPSRLFPGCAYCSVVANWGPSRSLNIERITSEIKGLIDMGVKRIVLSAPDILDYGREVFFKGKRFALDPIKYGANLYMLRKLFEKLYSLPEISSGEVRVIIENVKPCLVNEETAGLLGEYFEGTPINIGVESADEKLLRIMGRPCGFKDALRAIVLLSKNGLRPYAYLIYGLPGQDRESIYKTIYSLNKLVEAGVEKITLYRFQPLPSTILEKAEKPDPEKPENKELIDKVKKVNKQLKNRFLGRIFKVIIVSKDKNGYWGYPWDHGPVVFAVKRKSLKKNPVGRLTKVYIHKILNERVLAGEIIKIGRIMRKPSNWDNV